MLSRILGLSILIAFVVAVAASITACDPCGSCKSKKVTPTPTPTATPTPGASLSGLVQGGLSGISGAGVTLYAAGTGYGSNATVLGTATTDSDGSFTMEYTAPASPTVLYLVALRGNAGFGSNSAIGLTGVAGMSNAVPESVTINELTTAAAEWALAQFTDSTGQIIGAPLSNSTGLTNAANQAQANLADISSGLPASFWSDQGVTEETCTGEGPPSNCDGLERLDTIANILAACVQSSGPSSSACSTLLSNTSGSANTLQAAHVMAANPVANVAALFNLQSDSSPFTPALSAAPDGWEVALNFDPEGVLNGPVFVAIDAAGNVWAPNTGGNSVTELNPSGGLVGTFAPDAASFDGPDGVAIDAAGNVWITNFIGDSVSELLAGCSNSSCTGLNFAPDGSDFDDPFNLAMDTAGNAWITNRVASSVVELNSSGGLVGNFAPEGANFNFPQGVAIDTAGNVWIGNTANDTEPAVTGSVVELNSNGDLLGNFVPSGANFDSPEDVAIDATGNIWVTNISGDSVSELLAGCSGAGCTGLNFSPDGANFDFPEQVKVDAAGNAWVANGDGDSVTELNSSGGLAGNFAPIGADYGFPDGLAIDASGNVWTANSENDNVAEIVGAARPVLTPLVACLKRTPAHAVCLP